MTSRAQAVARDASREAAITREFDAPRERGWQALTVPKLFAQWWGPRGMPADVRALDVRPGGAYDIAMIGPDGARYPITGSYIEVVAPDRVVCTQNVDGHPKEWHEQLRAFGADSLGKIMTLTVSLEALGASRTRLTATTLFETQALRDAFAKLGMQVGWNSQLDKLEDITVDTTGRELSSLRLLDAPPERVYRAWVEPVRLARWWGPKGFTNDFEVCEPKPSGRWKFVMVSPDGARFPNESVFVELVPGQKVVIDHVVPPRFRLIAQFEAEGAGTRISWRQIFESKEVCDQVKGIAVPANEENFDRLAAELAAMR
jgi:uncharacterized protein YndB with AHSA1/START domain